MPCRIDSEVTAATHGMSIGIFRENTGRHWFGFAPQTGGIARLTDAFSGRAQIAIEGRKVCLFFVNLKNEARQCSKNIGGLCKSRKQRVPGGRRTQAASGGDWCLLRAV